MADIAPGNSGNDFNRCLASLSQKQNVPSDPAVLNVPYIGWNEMALTEYAWDSLALELLVVLKPAPAPPVVLVVPVVLPPDFLWHLNENPNFFCSFSVMYCMAHLPSIDPTANPFAWG